MPYFTQPLGDTVRNARLQLGLTQKEVAERINIDVRTVLNIENYKGNPKIEVLFPLVRTLKINPEVIFYPELEQNRPAANHLRLIAADCSEEEAVILSSAAESILMAIRSKEKQEIK